MTINLAEFERACLHGPLETVTPDMFMAAQRRIDELQQAFFRRKADFNDKWRMQARTRTAQSRNSRGRFCAPAASFAEKSIPNGDRE